MGGILVLLPGAITVVGLNTLIRADDDLTNPRSLVIVSMILVLGIGGAEISIGDFALGGIGLAGVVGVVLVTPTWRMIERARVQRGSALERKHLNIEGTDPIYESSLAAG